MKKLKKIMLRLTVMALLIPLSMGLAACSDKDDKNGGDVTGSTTIIGTWTFGTKTSANMITEVKVESTRITITYKSSQSITCTAYNGGTKDVNVNTTNNTFTASDNDTGNQVWSISGTLNDDGLLVLTGTITLINGYLSTPKDVSQTATSYKA